MRYAILSDIHSNLEALQAVFEACRYQNVDKILSLGDVVGYGASPNECLSILEKVGAVSVAGNHDWAVSGRLDASYFPVDGKESILWTRNKLSFEAITSLNSLELVYQNEDLAISHSSFFEPEAFIYLTNAEKTLNSFDVMSRPICFVGHTHVPKVYIKRENDVISLNIAEFELDAKHKYIVNVGSVGQPRDGNSFASYCIYDSDMHIVELKRIKYDVETAQRKIVKAGLPNFLSERLTIGK